RYSEFRNRIIQLRWKVEKVKQKIGEIKTQKQHDDALMRDSHVVTDMDVDSQVETESKAQIETPEVSPLIPAQNYPSHLTFDNPHMNMPTCPEITYNSGYIPVYESIPPPMLISDIWNQHRNYQFSHTVVDYNHGINESNLHIHDVTPLNTHSNQGVDQMSKINPNDTNTYYSPHWGVGPLKKPPTGNTNFYP
ncbi:hypothetical protein MXB_5665, partial [Myxobolus squamalis]